MPSLGYIQKGPKVIPNEGNSGGGGSVEDAFDIIIGIRTEEGTPEEIILDKFNETEVLSKLDSGKPVNIQAYVVDDTNVIHSPFAKYSYSSEDFSITFFDESWTGENYVLVEICLVYYDRDEHRFMID